VSERPFGAIYASAYDALYADKDYEAECDVLEGVFGAQPACGAVRSVLDLGCGTGAHAIRLSQRGYAVTGVDVSTAMLDHARANAEATTYPAKSVAPSFQQGDIRSLDLGRTFDAVVMMFAVLGYQLTNEDVLAALGCVRRHLAPGGVLIFDVWYGPAVARIGPTQRLKVLDVDSRRIIRVADAEVDERHGVCRVSYRLWELADDRLVAEAAESHAMRFFYPMELELLLGQAGFELRRLAAFPDIGSDANADTWNALVVSA
jgi:SAM-dependent methyltransferase